MEFTRCFQCMEEITGYPCPNCGYDPAKCPPLAYALQPGAILNGKYVVGTVLGQGGFGITYIGWDLALESRVAIKEYFPSAQVSRTQSSQGTLQWYNTETARTAQESGKEMFLKEARKMSRVSDIPQVVRVRDLFQQNETAYIVMDFIEGQTLKQRLKKTGPMFWEQAKDIFLPAIDAMERVHKAGLIHRDLSPDNLMLLPNGSVRILDLGAAKDLNINSGASSMQVAKGGFSPMEQYIQRGGSGPWTDVYAMAATMYFTLTGVLPLPSVDRLAEDTLRWDLPQLTALPENVLIALQKAMVLQPGKRTQTMMEFSHQLTRTAPAQNREADGNTEDGINDSYCQNDATEQKLSSGQITNEKEAEPSCNPACNSWENLTEPDSKTKDQELPRSDTAPQNETGLEKRLGRKPPKYILIALAAVIAVIVCFFSIHIWDDATCTEPAKCRICGKLQGDALGHSWKAATCLTAKTCSVCGQTSGSPLGHSWTPATYDAPETCKRCGLTQGTVKGYVKYRSGSWGPVQVSVGGTNSKPWVFDEAIKDCRRFTLQFQLTSVDYGHPYGNWAVYVKNLSGKWTHIGSISVPDNSVVTKTFSFDTPISFTQVVIACPKNTTARWSNSLELSDWYLSE